MIFDGDGRFQLVPFSSRALVVAKELPRRRAFALVFFSLFLSLWVRGRILLE